MVAENKATRPRREFLPTNTGFRCATSVQQIVFSWFSFMVFMVIDGGA